MILAWLEEDTIAWAYHLDRGAAALHEPNPLCDVNGLAVRMRMPGSPRTGGEANTARVDARRA